MKTRFLAVALLAFVAGVPVSAHDVPVEQVVRMSVRPDGAQLTVRLHIPTPLLADANLPKTADGHLKLDAIEPALRIIAADMANNLELEQDDVPLTARSSNAALAGAAGVFWNLAFVDVELMYVIVPDRGHLSARLNTFRGGGQVVRTVAAYEPRSGEARTISLVGNPERIEFDPDPIRVTEDFAVRGFRALMDHSEWLLFLACVALPLRPLREMRPAIAAFLAGQSLALAAAATLGSVSADLRLALELIAASAIVIVALRNITGATARWLWPLALGFGAFTGCILGQTFHDVAMFAGSHTLVALLAFAVVVTVGQAWAGSVVWAAVGVAYRWGLPERVAAIITAVVVAHTAIHRTMERADLLAQSSTMTVEHMLALLTLGWAALILGVGIYDHEPIR